MPEIKLNWGKYPQLKFQDAHEYYRTLGHLTNPDAYSISSEYNQKNGSYSDACRIHILSRAQNIPMALKKKETTNGRINCNEYIENLSKNHGFVLSGNMYSRIFQDVQAIYAPHHCWELVSPTAGKRQLFQEFRQVPAPAEEEVYTAPRHGSLPEALQKASQDSSPFGQVSQHW